MIAFENIAPEEDVFILKRKTDTEVLAFAVDRIRLWCVKTNHDVDMIDIDQEYVMSTLSKGVEAVALSHPRAHEPVIMIILDDGERAIIDGSHRVVAEFLRRNHSITAYILEAPEWEPFLINYLDDDGKIAAGRAKRMLERLGFK